MRKVPFIQYKPLSLQSETSLPYFFVTRKGEMVEWSITAVLKTAALKGAGGSNPSLSAEQTF